ncbi:PAS domain S-box protein [Methanoregula sp.]|uniref:PAS domain-containing protein n=1 Tax=Methanoregula sp. TaxID=2052170 RepID=UPI003C70D692
MMPDRVIFGEDWTPYDMLPVGIIVIRQDYTILSWNDCIADWTGIPKRSMVGLNLRERFPHLDKPLYLTRIAQVFSGGPAVIFSSHFHPHFIPAALQTGELRVQSTTVVPVVAGDGFLAMIVIEDITDLSRQVRAFREMKNVAECELEERKKAEEQALRLAAIVESSDDAIVGKTLDGIITSWNPGAERLYGYAAGEVLGKSLAILLPPDRSDDLPVVLARIRKGESISHYQTRRKTKDGRILDISLTVSPIRGIEGGVTGASSIARNITETKRMEEVLQQANKKLNLLNSITRHDILNQLMGLRAYLELSKECAKEPLFIEYIRKEEQAAENIGKQIEFTRSYQDIGVKSPAWQNLPSTIREAIDTLDIKQVALEIDLPQIEIFADPLLQRVFYNLVENAVRHGEILTTVRFRLEDKPGRCVLICEDDGVGVPAGVKEQIFKREYFDNTGFGLYLSREILSMTGISIRETGKPGQGARFEIAIPRSAFRSLS